MRTPASAQQAPRACCASVLRFRRVLQAAREVQAQSGSNVWNSIAAHAARHSYSAIGVCRGRARGELAGGPRRPWRGSGGALRSRCERCCCLCWPSFRALTPASPPTSGGACSCGELVGARLGKGATCSAAPARPPNLRGSGRLRTQGHSCRPADTRRGTALPEHGAGVVRGRGDRAVHPPTTRGKGTLLAQAFNSIHLCGVRAPCCRRFLADSEGNVCTRQQMDYSTGCCKGGRRHSCET